MVRAVNVSQEGRQGSLPACFQVPLPPARRHSLREFRIAFATAIGLLHRQTRLARKFTASPLRRSPPRPSSASGPG